MPHVCLFSIAANIKDFMNPISDHNFQYVGSWLGDVLLWANFSQPIYKQMTPVWCVCVCVCVVFGRNVLVLQCEAPTTAWGGTSICVFLPNLILNIYHSIHPG